MHGRRSLGVVVLLTTAIVLAVSTSAGQALLSHATSTQQCPDSQFPATRDPANPLVLPVAPGANPLHGAHFFIDGPRHGAAAGAIAQLLGIDPTTYPDNYSWAQFEQDLSPGGPLYPKLAADPALAGKVALLSRIAEQPETQNLSLYSQGGGPSALYSQVQKILCHSLTADPNPATVPVFSTFIIYPNGQFCPTLAAIQSNTATFQRQVSEVAAGTGRHPAVFVIEIDALGTSNCLHGDALAAWEADLRFEVQALTALPHSVVYIEAGAADEDAPEHMAQLIRDTCVVGSTNVCNLMRGFWVNGTHFDWSAHEITYADQVAAHLRTLMMKSTHQDFQAHYIVNTAQNGQGPKLNPHPLRQGIEDLCNPSGRGLGRAPTAGTAPTYDGHVFPRLDAFLWTGVPGRSHNSNCHPGDASAGVFDVNFALELAANASDQLGPASGNLVPPPDLGVSFDASTVSGTIYVKLPGGHAARDLAGTASVGLRKGGGYVLLTAARSLPVGTEIDARRGSLRVVTASGQVGKTQAGTFGGALFKLTQARFGLSKGLSTLTLLAHQFRGAPSFSGCARHPAADGAHIARRKPSVIQLLHASDHGGRFRTRGRYSAGTVRGTVWDTIDRCDGTLTVVHRGTVVVRDFPRRKTVVVHAGHSYLARAGRIRKG